MDAKRIYMSGIGGIGMSALAQMLASQGRQIAGSDRDASPTTELLESKGICVDIGQKAENVPEDTELLIYTAAVPPESAERVRAREKGVPELSYFEALGEISRGMRTVAVSGTNGKTTTTGMLTKILQAAGKEPTAIIGSIVRDFGSNYVQGSDDVFVVEACEYRSHFLKLSPHILVITNIELDHTDFFPDLKAVQDAFRTMAGKVPTDGAIITNPHDPVIAEVLQDISVPIIDYTQESVSELPLIGEFNQMNARAAKAAARFIYPDIAEGAIDRALLDFKGSWRRFEYKGETPQGALVYDDYAHHPTAIEKTIAGVREKFSDPSSAIPLRKAAEGQEGYGGQSKKIVVAFHPHLYSRTKSFLEEFAESLAQADVAIVAPIYAAREPLDPTVSNHILAERITAHGGNGIALDSFDQIRALLLKYGTDTLIITMGAGDIYKVAEEIAD